MPWAVGVLVIAPLAGRLTDRIGARSLIVAGLTVQGLGLAWVALNASNHRHYSASVVALIVSGCGTATAMPAVQNAVMNSVPVTALGKAAGTFNTLRQFGGALGVAVLAAVFAAHGSYASARAFSDGFTPAIAGSAAFALAGAVDRACNAGTPTGGRPAPTAGADFAARATRFRSRRGRPCQLTTTSAGSPIRTGTSCSRIAIGCSGRSTTPRIWCRRRICGRGADTTGSRSARRCARGCTGSRPVRA